MIVEVESVVVLVVWVVESEAEMVWVVLTGLVDGVVDTATGELLGLAISGLEKAITIRVIDQYYVNSSNVFGPPPKKKNSNIAYA